MLGLTVLLGLGFLAHGSTLPKSEGRIVGGVDTTIEEHPYQVSIEYLGDHWCGGSLIKPNVVLTAAHCTFGWFPSFLTVRAGSTKREQGGQVAKVLSACEHPKYTTKPQFDYDVSVLHLNRSFELGEGVQTIQLQPINVAVPDGTLAMITGWGTLFAGGNKPIILQKVLVPKVNDKVCQERIIIDEITPRMTCYGYDEGGKDACKTDSGGPLVAKGKQVGIVSWGYGCGNKMIPGIYARIENADIQNHINSCLKK